MNTPAPTSPAGLPFFAFEPSAPECSGAAFSPLFKALVWGISAGLLVWMLRLQLPWGQGATVWAWVAWATMAYTAWVVQRSRLHMAEGRIAQDWMWRKQIAIGELASLKLLRVRGLEWLMAPRIYARTMQGALTVFYCADPALLAEFERMASELARWRARVVRGE